MITGFCSPNLPQESWEAPVLHFLSSRFFAWAFGYCALHLPALEESLVLSNMVALRSLVVFFFIWEETVCFMWWCTWMCLRDSLSVIAAFLFWHKHIQTFLPNCRYAEALLMTPNLPYPAIIPSSGKSRLWHNRGTGISPNSCFVNVDFEAAIHQPWDF